MFRLMQTVIRSVLYRIHNEPPLQEQHTASVGDSISTQLEPSHAVKRRNGYQTVGRPPARSAGLRPLLELWLGLGTAHSAAIYRGSVRNVNRIILFLCRRGYIWYPILESFYNYFGQWDVLNHSITQELLRKKYVTNFKKNNLVANWSNLILLGSQLYLTAN